MIICCGDIAMVDFNNEGTISRPPKDIVALIIIEKHYNFLEADEFFCLKHLSGVQLSSANSRSRLRNLFMTTNALLKRRLEPSIYSRIENVCMDLSKTFTQSEVVECFLLMHNVLDKIGLLKLDVKPVYDHTDIEASNKAQGYD